MSLITSALTPTAGLRRPAQTVVAPTAFYLAVMVLKAPAVCLAISSLALMAGAMHGPKGNRVTGIFNFDNTYARLGRNYSQAQNPSAVAEPRWIAWNDTLAERLGWPIDWRGNDMALAALAGNDQLPGADPIATVYAGHQFGSYNPKLGDGRAVLLGELVTPDGARFDVQLKGAGPTPFSRGGDGRSPMGPVVREYLVSEAMSALGVPTSRALAAVASGEPVYRNGAEPGAVLTRIASSHLRIGSVQFFAMSQGGDGLSELIDYTVSRHFPVALEAAIANDPNATAASVLLDKTGQALASLVAQWQGLGFIHGVLNTDNMLLCGETIDYGPCAFMDDYDSAKVFSAIDTQGRYAYRNQPGIVHWNLSVLAQCLLPLLADDTDTALALAQATVDRFPDQFGAIHEAILAAKFGLDRFSANDRPLVDQFFRALSEDKLDFTLAFRWLTEQASGAVDHSPLPELFEPSAKLRDWQNDWQDRRGRNKAPDELSVSTMQRSNPVVIPRNHQIAQAIADAEHNNFETLTSLNKRWQKPFSWQSGDHIIAAPPTAEEVVQRTFCGT